MKMSKRLTSLVLSVLVSLSMLASCSSKTKDTVASVDSSKPMEITWMNTLDLATNNSYTTKTLPALLKKKGINVTINVKELGTHDATEWAQKFSMQIASGEKSPDIIQLGGFSLDAMKAGWFTEINMDMLKKTMPQYVEQVNKIDPSMWAFGKDPSNGKQYGIPSFNMFGSDRHAFIYRQDWLDKLNMQVPTTLQDFENWLIACRKTDFNGNGQLDEYGYDSGADGAGPGFGEIFGAHGLMPGQWMIKDGQVVRADIQSEVKAPLALLAKWYSQGLLPKGVMTTSKRDNDFYTGISGTWGQAGGYAPAIVPSGSYYTQLIKQQPNAKIAVAKSPIGPTGKFGTWEWGPKKYVVCFGSQLQKDPAKLDTILKMLYTIASDKELFETAMLGQKGVHWEFIDKVANLGATQFISPYQDFNKKLNEVGVRDMSESAFCPIWLESVYKDYIDPLAVKYASINTQYWDPLLSINLPSSSQYQTDLDNLTKSAYLDIITGRKPLDSFDNYVKTWSGKGGDILTKEANDAYQKMFK